MNVISDGKPEHQPTSEVDELASVVQRIVDGDDTAIEEFHKKLLKGVYLLVYRNLRNAGFENNMVAEEIAADVLTKAWEKIHCFDPEKGNVRQWVYGFARNECKSYIRKKARRSSIMSEFIDDTKHFLEQTHITLPQNGIECALTENEIWDEVYSIIKQLPDSKRRIIEQYYFEGKSIKEIAYFEEELPSTIDSRLRRTLTSIRGMVRFNIYGTNHGENYS